MKKRIRLLRLKIWKNTKKTGKKRHSCKAPLQKSSIFWVFGSRFDREKITKKLCFSCGNFNQPLIREGKRPWKHETPVFRGFTLNPHTNLRQSGEKGAKCPFWPFFRENRILAPEISPDLNSQFGEIDAKCPFWPFFRKNRILASILGFLDEFSKNRLF